MANASGTDSRGPNLALAICGDVTRKFPAVERGCWGFLPLTRRASSGADLCVWVGWCAHTHTIRVKIDCRYSHIVKGEIPLLKCAIYSCPMSLTCQFRSRHASAVASYNSENSLPPTTKARSPRLAGALWMFYSSTTVRNARSTEHSLKRPTKGT
jgi:hypothetical protein